MYSMRLHHQFWLKQFCRSQLFHKFYSSYSPPAAAGNISDSELQAARAYCSNLLLYIALFPLWTYPPDHQRTNFELTLMDRIC